MISFPYKQTQIPLLLALMSRVSIGKNGSGGGRDTITGLSTFAPIRDTTDMYQP